MNKEDFLFMFLLFRKSLIMLGARIIRDDARYNGMLHVSSPEIEFVCVFLTLPQNSRSELTEDLNKFKCLHCVFACQAWLCYTTACGLL